MRDIEGKVMTLSGEPTATSTERLPTAQGGPLTGIKVIELAGLGPGPFAAMMLADLGAEVIRVDQVDKPPMFNRRYEVNGRSRRSIALNLKTQAGREIALTLAAQSDALIEGMRPGVAERLGIGPDACLASNPALVYGRISGWGQDGPYSQMAGHDLTYLAITGGLHSIGHADRPPVPPLNAVADFGGGGMHLAFGVLAGILRARESGQGDVIDASIVESAGSLFGMIRGLLAEQSWQDERESNLLDGGAPYYRVYRCADGKDVAVGAIEPIFWEQLIQRVGLGEDPLMYHRDDRSLWPQIRRRLTERFLQEPRDEWVRRTVGSDACLAPVLSLEESTRDEHLLARHALTQVNGIPQPSPSPRFRYAGTSAPRPTPEVGAHSSAILQESGYTSDQIKRLRETGAIA